MELFVRQIKAYGIVSQRPLLIATAWVMVFLELTLGMAMMVAYRPKIVFPAISGLLFIFLGVAGWGWLSGATESCGCFGAWLERTPGEAAVEDLVLLAFTALAWAGFRGLQIRQARWRPWPVFAASIVGLALPVALGFPSSGIDRSSSGSSKQMLGHFPVQGLKSVDLNTGHFLLVVMDTGCDHCQDIIPEFNMLAETPGLPSVVALCVNGKSERQAFVDQYQPVFPLGQIDDDVFWRLLGDGDMPRSILVRNGYVTQVWDVNPPPADAITAAFPY
jgi:hypothetical protein